MKKDGATKFSVRSPWAKPRILPLLFLVFSLTVSAQEEDVKVKEKALSTLNNLTYDANQEIAENNFVEDEANYRRAISKSGDNTAAKYNLGNAYYNQNSMGEAFTRFKQAGETTEDKAQKHKSYHNMGNVFMKNKEYQKAVDAYKEALRNNPSDEETRYNLALAKEMLKKQQEENKNDQNKNDQNKDQQNKDDQNKKDNKEGEDKKDDKGDQDKNEDKKPDENNDKGDKKEDKKDENKDKGQPKDEQGEQPRPNQLSPQQVKNILEAMNNEEKKVQDKINAQKVQGKPVKAEKDW